MSNAAEMNGRSSRQKMPIRRGSKLPTLSNELTSTPGSGISASHQVPIAMYSASGMRAYRYRLLNVFTIDGDRFSGNPLCVFEDARTLTDAEMQSIALQFNLSETTFILPSETATARVRIFTPSFEMPFAGHPTLGTAHVVRALLDTGDEITLEMKAGVVPVRAGGDTWALTARSPSYRDVEVTTAQLTETLGLAPGEVRDGARWVDTGSLQLVVPLVSTDALARCKPTPELLLKLATTPDRRPLAYAIADDGERETAVRFFFLKGNQVVEDPATGSACANLGGWLLDRGAPLPLGRTVRQGSFVGRPSRLFLRVDAERQIEVRGEVIELGTGEIRL